MIGKYCILERNPAKEGVSKLVQFVPNTVGGFGEVVIPGKF